MIQYTFTKVVNPTKLQAEIRAVLPALHHVETVDPDELYLFFPEILSTENLTLLTGLVSNHIKQSSQEYVESVIKDSIGFGMIVMVQFAAQNVLLGITQEGKTGEVLVKLSKVVGALQTGSLREAIQYVRDISPSDYDAKYITAARLLTFVNKVETYLQIPLSSSL